MSTLAYIGLGSNLGDRVQHIIDARQRLFNLPHVLKTRSSSLYLSSPVGYSQQDDFLNCVIELEVCSNAFALFVEMQQIEQELGRERDHSNQNAPRTIDIDLLIFGDESIDTADLIVPHPRLAKRLFVLNPLMELNSKLEIIGLGNIQQLIRLGEFNDQTLYQLGPKH